MTETLKRLGNCDVSATTNTALYQVPPATTVVVSTVAICNRNASSVKIRLGHTLGVYSAITVGEWIYYDVTIPAYDTLTMTVGVTMGTSNSLVAYSNTANVGFTAWGTEIT
jgi:hypothetical protein